MVWGRGYRGSCHFEVREKDASLVLAPAMGDPGVLASRPAPWPSQEPRAMCGCSLAGAPMTCSLPPQAITPRP